MEYYNNREEELNYNGDEVNLRVLDQVVLYVCMYVYICMFCIG